MWGPVVSGVLLRLNGLGLWPNDPIQGRCQIRRQSTKVVVEMALQEELKVIYDRPKPIRGGLKPSYPPEYYSQVTS